MIMLQLARMSGACKIIVSEPVASKRTLAEKLGADITIDPIYENLEAVLKTHTQNISTVIECAGTVSLGWVLGIDMSSNTISVPVDMHSPRTRR